jgi:hypothetical protein
MPNDSRPKLPSQDHPVPAALAVALGRLNMPDATSVMIGRAASPPDDEDRRYFAWVTVPDGVVIEIDEVEAVALRDGGADEGVIPRCPACGEVAGYGKPIDGQHDAWNCADDGTFIAERAKPDGPLVATAPAPAPPRT